MGKVDLTLIQAPPQKSVIEHLNTLLAEAEKGELQGIAYVSVYRGNYVGSSFSDLDCPATVMGQLLKLQLRIAAAEVPA